VAVMVLAAVEEERDERGAARRGTGWGGDP